MTPLKAVTLDVTGTLLHTPRVAAIYREVLMRHGLDASEASISRYLAIVWQEFNCLAELGRDRFTAHPDGPRGWWFRFLKRLCAYLELDPPSRFAGVELFDRFAQPAAWELFPDTVPALETLQRAGVPMVVVSNWDHRLPQLLERLGLDRFFRAVIHSSAVGVEKPHPLIFRQALERLDTEAGETLHIGDSRARDVEGARGAGLVPCWLVRGLHRAPLPQGDLGPAFSDLSTVAEHVAGGRPWPPDGVVT